MPKPAPIPIPKPKPIPRPKPIRRHSPSNRLQVPSTPSNNFTSPPPSSYFTAQESLPQSEFVVPSPEYPPPWYGFSDDIEEVQDGQPSDDAEKWKGKGKERGEKEEVNPDIDEMEDQEMHDADMAFLNSTPREGDGGDLGPEKDADYEPGPTSPSDAEDEALSDDDDDDDDGPDSDEIGADDEDEGDEDDKDKQPSKDEASTKREPVDSHDEAPSSEDSSSEEEIPKPKPSNCQVGCLAKAQSVLRVRTTKSVRGESRWQGPSNPLVRLCSRCEAVWRDSFSGSVVSQFIVSADRFVMLMTGGADGRADRRGAPSVAGIAWRAIDNVTSSRTDERVEI